MKTLKKVWFRTFILAISFIAISCSVEEKIVKNNQGIIHRKIKFDELKKDKVVMEDLTNYSKFIKESSLKQKSTDSLVVDISFANYVETDEFISYTFNMPSSSVPLRNFLLKKQKNSTGGYHGYVLNYNLTQEELNSLNTLELTNLSNKVTSVKIGSNFSPSMFGKNVYCPGIVGICYVGDPDGHVAYGSECTVSAVQVEMFPCPEDGGGGTPSDPINPPPPNDNTGGSDNNQVVIIPTFNDSDFFDFDNQCKANFFISPSVTSDMRNWLNHFNNIFFKNKIYEMVEDQSSCEENHTEALAIWNYLYNNQTVASSIIDFVLSGGDQNLAWDLVGLAKNEPNQQDVDELVNMSLIFEKYKDNFDNENFILEMDQYMVDFDTIAFMLANPGIAFSNYFTLQCAVLRKNHPSWSDAKIYWEAAKVFVHIALDVVGLVPVVGEVADLTNGLLYVIEGDGVNAALSVASAIPIVGWASVTTKYAIKITSVGSTKVVLTWKKIGILIDFGNRADLRKMLGLAVGNTLQAHHIVPWAIRQHDVIQKAAKSIQAFHMNETLNGIAVAAWRNQPNHNTYNNLIKSKLDALPSNLTPDQAFDEVANILNQA